MVSTAQRIVGHASIWADWNGDLYRVSVGLHICYRSKSGPCNRAALRPNIRRTVQRRHIRRSASRDDPLCCPSPGSNRRVGGKVGRPIRDGCTGVLVPPMHLSGTETLSNRFSQPRVPWRSEPISLVNMQHISILERLCV